MGAVDTIELRPASERPEDGQHIEFVFHVMHEDRTFTGVFRVNNRFNGRGGVYSIKGGKLLSWPPWHPDRFKGWRPLPS